MQQPPDRLSAEQHRSDLQPTPLGIVGPVLLCTIFGANVVAIKVGFTGLGPLTSAGIRFTLAAATIAAWAGVTGRRFRLARPERVPMMVLCLLFTVQLSLFYLGLARTLATRGTLIVNLVPFFVLIFAHLFLPGDRINARKLIGSLFGFTGVALVLTDGNALGSGWSAGDTLVLCGTLIWASHAVFTKTVIHRFQSFQLALYPMACAGFMLLLAGWWWDDAMVTRIDLAIAAAMVYQSLICAAIGFIAWNNLLKRYGASTLHSFLFILPVSGVAAAGLILGEPITPTLLAAMALVATGIGIVNFRRRRTRPAYPLGRSL